MKEARLPKTKTETVQVTVTEMYTALLGRNKREIANHEIEVARRNQIVGRKRVDYWRKMALRGRNGRAMNKDLRKIADAERKLNDAKSRADQIQKTLDGLNG